MPIKFVKNPFSREESLACLDSIVREWFERRFKELTPPQQYSFKLISQNKNVLIASPTGTGKTLSAFLALISELFVLAKKGKLENCIYAIYVSPLKALLNDIQKNLLVPIEEINSLAKEKGIEIPEIRVAVRSGDVKPHKKQEMLRKRPHILITTPESLAIVLNSPKFSQHLQNVSWIVVDEIHELANNKRGVLLSLAIERLVEKIKKEIIRIGLGATLHPLEEAAKFLVGYNKNGRLRNCYIVDVTWKKKMDLTTLFPASFKASAEECNKALYNKLDELIKSHTTTLVFTNTRSATERIVHVLKEKFGYSDSEIAAHHGSLSRDIRLDVENKLKNGELKAVISSTSLELGIDIGFIDLVVQIGSPKSVTRAVQRIGRSGHGFKDIAKGRIIVLDRDDLVECSVMLKCAKEKILDRFEVIKNPLDILAQHVVGMALEKKWGVDEALDVIRRSYCYHNLEKEDFIKLLHYLAGHYASLEDRSVYGKIWFDAPDNIFGRRGKYTRIIYFLNIGAIPDEVSIDVYTIQGKYVGNIEEEFLARLRKGDIFLLGGKPYLFRYARGLRCFVEPMPHETNPTIPNWFSELLPLSFDLAIEIQKFREKIKGFLARNEKKEHVISWLLKNYPIDENSAKTIYHYLLEQWLYCKKIPGKNILIEKTQDLQGRRHIVFHALFGRRVNDALSRLLAIIISDMINSNVATIITDNGFSIMIPRDKNVNIEKAINSLITCEVAEFLKENIRRTELMKRRFRHCASRSFLVLRNYKGYKISVSKQQRNSETLLRVCEKIDKDFPIIKEAYREILNDTADLKRTKEIISLIKNKKIKYEVIETSLASPFAHGLLILGEADIITMKDRKRRLLELYENIMRRIGYEDF
ncbi:MAG: ATP-dependent helicase [Candidatus Aenigmatarchaeota archaeon]